jgi:glycosyltransferase involved in cell wall biosynthesis
MIKISIITVTLNSELTIKDTLNSILSQRYKNIEHIIVDGGSSDQTIEILKKYPNKNKKIYSYNKSGIYQAINYGIKKSNGDYITILNSDDFYQSDDTISNVVKVIKKNINIKIFFGNIIYFKQKELYNIKRYYSATNFNKSLMRYGIMPPHPASFIGKEIYQTNSPYREDFMIASDFEFFLRTIYIKKIKYKKINQTIVRMRMGGISTRNFLSYIISTKEILRSFLLNKIKINVFSIVLRLPIKAIQYYNFNQKKLNKDMKIFQTFFYKDDLFKDNFNLINDFKNIPFKKNFILSAMNLAFLGYYAAKKVYPHKDLYHWMDGIWAKKYTNLKKKPGRELIKKLMLPKEIKTIFIIGNISKKSIKYLITKTKKKIVNKTLPYASIDILKKSLIKLPAKSLTFITLPTPKQEQLAYSLTKTNKEYKIICIGASIAIASGEEREVPKSLKNMEFIWRLRTDTIRRLSRIIETIYYFLKGRYILRTYLKTSFKKID